MVANENVKPPFLIKLKFTFSFKNSEEILMKCN